MAGSSLQLSQERHKLRWAPKVNCDARVRLVMQRALKNWITVFQNWFSSICNSGYESTMMMGWQSLNGTNPIWKGRGRLLKLYLHATKGKTAELTQSHSKLAFICILQAQQEAQ
jgi:hypothetical protein